jgi:ABC-2 type transport system permease protein
MKSLIIIELKRLIRERYLLSSFIVFLLALVIASYFSTLQTNQKIKDREDIAEKIRNEWEELDNMNPHSAAHFGTYAFKPVTALSAFDEGINAYTGNVLRLEGHIQHNMVHSELSHFPLISYFGKITPSFLLQYILSIFIIFIAFITINGEKESGRLKLYIVQGTTLREILLSKVLIVWFISILLTLFTIASQIIINIEFFTYDDLLRSFLLLFSYSTYYLILILITIYSSVVLKNAAKGLTLVLALWFLWVVFLPRVSSNISDSLYKLPTRNDLIRTMKEEREKGVDGHNPFDKKRDQLKENLLKEYSVQNVEDLPINFDGIVMQADEEFGNMVWDKHYGDVNTTLLNQRKTNQFLNLLNPFSSLRNLSIGTAGTDLLHHLDFLHKAEEYRRVFIKRLNDEMAYGGSKTGEWEWKSDNKFFKSVEDFNYSQPAFASLFPRYLFDVLSLIIWASLFLLLSFSLRNQRRLSL